jgi:hypothetical protein
MAGLLYAVQIEPLLNVDGKNLDRNWHKWPK